MSAQCPHSALVFDYGLEDAQHSNLKALTLRFVCRVCDTPMRVVGDFPALDEGDPLRSADGLVITLSMLGVDQRLEHRPRKAS